MPVPTEQLADEIRKTNHRLADTNQAVRELARNFDRFRVEMAQQFAAVNAKQVRPVSC